MLCLSLLMDLITRCLSRVNEEYFNMRVISDIAVMVQELHEKQGFFLVDIFYWIDSTRGTKLNKLLNIKT